MRQEIQEQVQPLIVTWGHAQWSGSARKYEDYDTRDFPEVLSLGDALDFQAALGEEAKITRLRALRDWIYQRVASDSRFAWRSPVEWEMGGALFAVEVAGRSSTQVSDRIWREHGIVVRRFQQPGLNALRVSPGVFNTEEELERLLETAGA